MDSRHSAVHGVRVLFCVGFENTQKIIERRNEEYGAQDIPTARSFSVAGGAAVSEIVQFETSR